MQNCWYRNVGSKIYHEAADDWVSTGLSVCRRKIPHPCSTAHSHRDVPRSAKPCKDCMRKGDKP